MFDNIIWKVLELKIGDKKVFNGLSVNNEIFSLIENIKEFVKKFYEGIKLNIFKVNDDILIGEVILVDYVNDLFFKEFNL